MEIKPEISIDVKEVPEVAEYKVGEECKFIVTGRKMGSHIHDIGTQKTEHKSDFEIINIEHYDEDEEEDYDE